MPTTHLMLGDCREKMAEIQAGSVDAIIGDPPAGISFLGREWDHHRGGRSAWVDWLAVRLAECHRVAKPGARALIWALPRTSHWTGTAIEDAGWAIEDRVSHLFGQGYPKHKSKLKPACEDWWLAIKPDRAATPLNIDACRIEGVVLDSERRTCPRGHLGYRGSHKRLEGERHNPAGRYPANVVLSCDCGDGPHDDGCPVAELDRQSGDRPSGTKMPHHRRNRPKGWSGPFADDDAGPAFRSFTGGDSGGASRFFKVFTAQEDELILCRAKAIIQAWNPNLASTADDRSSLPSEHVVSALSHAVTLASEGAIRLGDARGLSTSVTPSELRTLCENAIAAILSSASESSPGRRHERPTPSPSLASHAVVIKLTDTTTITTVPLRSDGSAASATSGAMPCNTGRGAAGSPSRFIYCAKASRADRGPGNAHVTCKSTTLMAWLCRLITPPGGTILDPFMGSGSTGVAALREGFDFIGIESDPESFATAESRIAVVHAELPLFASPA
jgi:hypothetical protein